MEGQLEHAEDWFFKWERQCLDEVEQEKQLPPELQEEEEEEMGPKRDEQKLWHLFPISTNSVAHQLYKGGCLQPEHSMWEPFQSVATAVTSLYKERRNAHQRNFDLGVQIGYQRNIKDVLNWVKKGISTILENLISFLCGKVPPIPPPRRTPNSPKPPGPLSQASATEYNWSVDVDLKPFPEAIILHGLRGPMVNISMPSDPASPSSQASEVLSSFATDGLQKYCILEDDLNLSDLEDLAFLPASGGRCNCTSAQCSDGMANSPTHKHNRMVCYFCHQSPF
ncbi:LOW QUALITY PROTEIN: HUWE1-associated protein modifying stress responses 2 [Rhynchonycteris naso]